MVKVDEARGFVSSELSAVADPDKAPQMQAYMKTYMPFYGVQKAGRTRILRQFVRLFVPDSRAEYEVLVRGLWSLPHREEKYLSLGVARHFEDFVVPGSLGLYTDLIVEGAWWDLVDEVATKLIRSLVMEHPNETWPMVDTWIDSDDMWLRRSAIICQIGAKEKTDTERLFRFCAGHLDETEFFIRKAIGWALREYAKTDPGSVADVINAHVHEMSGLTYREGSKHIAGLVDPR
jgi:3-methyladenine DNA glycosylase AlkD